MTNILILAGAAVAMGTIFVLAMALLKRRPTGAAIRGEPRLQFESRQMLLTPAEQVILRRPPPSRRR